MSSMLQQYYTQNEIKYFVYNGLGDSIRDNIILDGKSIWERMEAEGGAVMNQRIMAHYGTVGTATMQIFINKKSQSIDFIDMTQEHTLTIKAGFQVPNGGTVAQDMTFIYNPATKAWSVEGSETTENISVDAGQSSYPIEGSGCNGIAAQEMLPVAAVLLGVTAVMLKKGRKQA